MRCMVTFVIILSKVVSSPSGWFCPFLSVLFVRFQEFFSFAFYSFPSSSSWLSSPSPGIAPSFPLILSFSSLLFFSSLSRSFFRLDVSCHKLLKQRCDKHDRDHHLHHPHDHHHDQQGNLLPGRLLLPDLLVHSVPQLLHCCAQGFRVAEGDDGDQLYESNFDQMFNAVREKNLLS